MVRIEEIGQTPFLVFTNLVLLFLVYFVMRSSIKYPYSVPKSKRQFSLFLVFLFCVFSFWGSDWFHYLDKYSILREGYQTNIESVYSFIAINLSPNYLFFRIIIWGMALSLFIITLKRLSINYDIAILVFGSVWVIYFSYARVSLAMSMMFLGASLFYLPVKRFVVPSYIIGLLLVLSAYFFHKTSLYGVSIIFLALFIRRIPKSAFIVLLLLFPLIVYGAQSFMTDFMTSSFDADEGSLGAYASVGQNYLEKDYVKKGIGTILQRVLEVFPLYLLAWQSLRIVDRSHETTVPKDIQFFARVLFFIVFTASIFLFNLRTNTSVVFIRFIRFSIIPATIILSYMLGNQSEYRIARPIFYLSFISSLYAVTYMMYCSA